VDWIILLLKIVIPLFVILNLLPFLIWLERKGSAFIQDRPGPNRASIKGIRVGGLVHSLADVIKLFFKEEIIPSHVNRGFYLLAPGIALFVAFITYIVLPFAAPMPFHGSLFTFQAADLNVGILYILAMSSLGVYGIMLAGWSSNNKYALLGGVRSSAQMISYELSMGLSLMSVLMMAGSVNLNDIVGAQTHLPYRWNVLVQPIACVIFIISAFAETNRAPFDLPEGESELVAGYHVEYSSMKFAAFFMAEYVHMIMASAMIATLFFGGWQVPFVSTETLRDNADKILMAAVLGFAALSFLIGILLVAKFKRGKYGDKRDFEVLIFGVPAILAAFALPILVFAFAPPVWSQEARYWLAAGFQAATFLGKILFFCWVFIWVRWTLPRFRYDHLMNLGWKVMLPLAMANVAVYAVGMVVWSL
jgi:NADH-quinone oxidoreductase subunit H